MTDLCMDELPTPRFCQTGVQAKLRSLQTPIAKQVHPRAERGLRTWTAILQPMNTHTTTKLNLMLPGLDTHRRRPVSNLGSYGESRAALQSGVSQDISPSPPNGKFAEQTQELQTSRGSPPLLHPSWLAWTCQGVCHSNCHSICSSQWVLLEQWMIPGDGNHALLPRRWQVELLGP